MASNDELFRVLDYYNLVGNATLSEKFKVVCPFHGDEKPSLQINLDTGTFYCYGCGVKGDAKKFVQMMEQTDDLKTLIKLNKILKSKGKSDIKVKKLDKLSAEDELAEAKQFFYSLPVPSWEYIKRSYMHNRGFSTETLIKADVRLNPNSTYGVAMPMLDMGIFKGYVCRATQEADRKYLYNKGFSRANTLVGRYDRPWVVITEGYMDWLKFQQFNVHNSCAILGWKATDEQIKKLSEYTDCVISALDNTETGREGTKYLKKYFKVVRFKFPENVKDIGEMNEFDFNKAWIDTVDAVKKIDKTVKKRNWR